jgi:uncharacterized membrane protein
MTSSSPRLVQVATAAVGAAAIIAAVGAARRRRRRWRAEGRPVEHTLAGVADVGRPREDLYELCSSPARLGSVLGHGIHVEVLNSETSQWTMTDGQAGRFPPTVVEIVGDTPLVVIAWQATSGLLPHEGTLRLGPSAAGADHTRLEVELRYRWSAKRARSSGIPNNTARRALDQALRAVQRWAGQPVAEPMVREAY